MKSKKKYKILLLPLFSAVAFSTVGYVASCSSDVYFKNNHIREVTQGDINKKSYNELKTVDVSIANLLTGSENINNGNYLVIIGSTSWTATNMLLNGNELSDKFQWSGLFDVFSYFDSLSKLGNWVFPNPTKIFTYLDIAVDADCTLQEMNTEIDANSKVEIDSSKEIPNISDPFNKWKDMGDNASSLQKSRAGKYVRQDESAVNFRNLIDILSKVFNKSLTGESLSKSPVVIGYKYDYENKKVVHQFKDASTDDSQNPDDGTGSGDSNRSAHAQESISSHEKKNSTKSSTELIEWVKSFYTYPDK